jgi:hypothetical protein
MVMEEKGVVGRGGRGLGGTARGVLRDRLRWGIWLVG